MISYEIHLPVNKASGIAGTYIGEIYLIENITVFQFIYKRLIIYLLSFQILSNLCIYYLRYIG